nr:uncharacterized protein LOC113719387 [Coffea arabica]
MPQEPEPNAPAAARNAYKKHKDDNREVSCIMVASMIPQLQQQHMKWGHMILCKMAEGAPVAPHVLKIIGLIEKLAELGFKMDQELNVDLVLQSLPDSFSQFVMNFR